MALWFLLVATSCVVSEWRTHAKAMREQIQCDLDIDVQQLIKVCSERILSNGPECAEETRTAISGKKELVKLRMDGLEIGTERKIAEELPREQAKVIAVGIAACLVPGVLAYVLGLAIAWALAGRSRGHSP